MFGLFHLANLFLPFSSFLLTLSCHHTIYNTPLLFSVCTILLSCWIFNYFIFTRILIFNYILFENFFFSIRTIIPLLLFFFCVFTENSFSSVKQHLSTKKLSFVMLNYSLTSENFRYFTLTRSELDWLLVRTKWWK